MPDVHFHDVYATFDDQSFVGLRDKLGNENVTIRTMASQLRSTRLFNENYFAFLAALDDVVNRGIRYVALPGDFSDDGQPVHVRGLSEVLDRYREMGVRFFVTTGNHDPTRPYGRAGGKPDYLGDDGRKQPIYSEDSSRCKPPNAQPPLETALPVICSNEVREAGYFELLSLLGQHGFFPQPDDVYWESPFSGYSSTSYEFALASKQSALINRQYEVCQGDACTLVPDASYLVEPVPGIWILAIDANVFVPSASAGSEGKNSFEGASSAGYNRVLTHKTHLLEWISSVSRRADTSGKQLITFSHYPMLEFDDGQSRALASVFGTQNSDWHRTPSDITSQALLESGVSIHLGGHMNMNDTSARRSSNGKYLINIQVPSLASYPTAYKIVSLSADQKIEVETIEIEDVPGFDVLFPLYEEEHEFLADIGSADVWDDAILNAKTYGEFAEAHLRALVIGRYLPNDWPSDIANLLTRLDGSELLTLSRLVQGLDYRDCRGFTDDIEELRDDVEWQEARERAMAVASQANLSMDALSGWNGTDLAVDYHRVRLGDQRALRDIGDFRLNQYRFVADSIVVPTTQHCEDSKVVSGLGKLKKLLAIVLFTDTAMPTEHFRIDTKTGQFETVSSSRERPGY